MELIRKNQKFVDPPAPTEENRFTIWSKITKNHPVDLEMDGWFDWFCKTGVNCAIYSTGDSRLAVFRDGMTTEDDIKRYKLNMFKKKVKTDG